MEQLSAELTRRLGRDGVGSRDLSRLIRDVGGALSASPSGGREEINRVLPRLGWGDLALDEETFDEIRRILGSLPGPPPGPERPRKVGEGLREVLEQVYRERGVDFRGYSKTSLDRRLRRRLQALGLGGYREYLGVLEADPDEYGRLFDEVTINVTSFFRDRAAFEALERALAATLAERPAGGLRLWSAGCATGEEPYSLAITLLHLLDGKPPPGLELLATDIDANALDRGRAGVFEPPAVKHVPRRWLERYFRPEGGRFRVTEQVRELVTFRRHNVLTDPPFQELDAVACRNLLIYFDPPVQLRVLDKLHRGLREGGRLLLGRYEMLLHGARRKFACVDFDARLYVKRAAPVNREGRE